MSQGMKTHQSLVDIGSKYTGPSLDRPALRRMPEGWYLYEPEKHKRPHIIRRTMEFVMCLVAAFGAVAAATMIAVWITGIFA